MARGVRSLTTAALVAVAVTLSAGPASADPLIGLSVRTVAVGDTILVTTSGWPRAVTATVCGNAGHRGAVDCDQTGAVGLAASVGTRETRPLTVARPPAPCPCVVRVATAGDDIVRSSPIEIAGIGTAPIVEPDTTRAGLEVFVHLDGARGSLLTKLQSSLGGRTRRALVLTLVNRADAPVDGISGTAAVARTDQGGEPLPVPALGPVPAHQARTYRMPVSIGAPAFGSYVVYGTIYGTGSPVTFSAATHTTPWALILVLVALVFDIGVVLATRVRRRRAAATLPRWNTQTTPGQTRVEQTSRRPISAERASMVASDVSLGGPHRVDSH